MHDTSRSPDHQALFDVASEQMGYFTAAQATACGYAPYLLTYHTRRGTFRRVHRGVYRFRDFPPSPHEEVMAAWLAVGNATAVVSHESALELLDLSDVIPNVLHLTVPRAHRSLAKGSLPGVTIHTSTRPFEPADVWQREGLRVTSPERTILDAAEASTQPEQIHMAISQALERGWLDAGAMRRKASARGRRVADLVARSLDRQAPQALVSPR
jgi:predicted transcriptional regulator of viral defense system